MNPATPPNVAVSTSIVLIVMKVSEVVDMLCAASRYFGGSALPEQT
jgi:hypothetical protein